IVIGLLGAISLILFFISFPLPILPPYLKVDFSDIPALIAGIIFSPIAGVLVILVKNGLYFVISVTSDLIGVVSNFLAGSVLYYRLNCRNYLLTNCSCVSYTSEKRTLFCHLRGDRSYRCCC